MMDRAYTVSEIDQLRAACRMRYLYGTANRKIKLGHSRAYKEEEMNKTVEEQVRTFMFAGITAKEIYKKDEGK